MFHDTSQFEQALRYCADPAVTAALDLLNTGAALDELVAVLDASQGSLSVVVGRRHDLFAAAPELVQMLSHHPVPLGDLQWLAVLGSQVAWGTFSVVPRARAEA